MELGRSIDIRVVLGRRKWDGVQSVRTAFDWLYFKINKI